MIVPPLGAVPAALLLAFCALVLCPHAQAQAPAQDPALDAETLRVRGRFQRLVEEEEAALVVQLWELAEWCMPRKLYRERDRLSRLVLEIEPEHRGARKVLKYHSRGDGWVQSRTYRMPRSHATEKNSKEYRQGLAAATDPYRSRLFRRIERDGRKLAPGTRELVLRKLLILDPDDLAIRTVLGERFLGNRWVLEETARAAEEGTGVASLAAVSLEKVRRPDIDAPNRGERDTGLVWNATMKTPRVRVVGTTPRKEVDETARVTEAMGHLFHRVFKHGQSQRPDYTIYLLRDSGERQALMQGLGIDAATQTNLSRAAGGWLDPNRLGEWDANPARRLDGAARQTLGAMLMDAYGIDGSHGWAWEGMGLYLTYRMVGTRMTYFVDRGSYTTPRVTTLWPKLQAAETAWLAEARLLLARDDAPGLVFLLGRSVDTMRDEDILAAYALSAYLLEGRPDDVPLILKRIGQGEHPVTVFEQVTGFALPDLEQRLRRWLDEILAG